MDQMNVKCMQIDKLNLVCNSLGQEFSDSLEEDISSRPRTVGGL